MAFDVTNSTIVPHLDCRLQKEMFVLSCGDVFSALE